MRFIIFFICFNTLGQSKNLNNFFINNYSYLDYKASSQNWDIKQNSAGIMYFGNEGGLLEYDGKKWRIYENHDKTSIRSLAIAKERIYVGSQREFGYFEPNETGHLTYYSLTKNLNDIERQFDDVWQILITEEGVFFRTFKKLFHYNPKNDDITVFNSQENSFGYITYIKGKIFIAKDDQLYQYSEKKWIALTDKNTFLATKEISAILPHRSHQLLIATYNNGFFYFDDGEFQPVEWKSNHTFKKNIIYSTLALKQANQYAIGTSYNGIFIIDNQGNILNHVNQKTGLKNETISKIFQDTYYNIWLLTTNTISQIQINSPFRVIKQQFNLNETGYSALVDKNNLFLGTNKKLIIANLDDNSVNKHFEGHVWKVRKIKNHILISKHEGAFWFKDNDLIPLRTSNGSWKFESLKTKKLRKSTFALEGTYQGFFLYELNDKKITLKWKIEGIDESSRIFFQDDDGYIWMSNGYIGVFRLKLSEDLKRFKEIKIFGKKDGLADDRLNDIFLINQKIIVTSKNGIYIYNKKKENFEIYPNLNNLFSGNQKITYLKETYNGDIFFLGQNTFGRIYENTQGTYKSDHTIFRNITHRLTEIFFDIFQHEEKNTIYLTAKEGFITYNSNFKIRNNNPNIVPFLRSVSIHLPKGDSLLFTHNYSKNLGNSSNIFPYTFNNISFEMSYPFYINDQETYFQYLLEGFQEQWSKWTPNSTKEYLHLPEGKYTFHFRTKNSFGTILAAESYTFIIKAPFYKSIWAYTIYIIISIYLFWQIIYFIVRKYKVERSYLKTVQRQELAKKDEKIKTIAKKAETTIAELEKEKLEAKLEGKNRQLITSAAHIAHNNQLLKGILGDLKNLKKINDTQEICEQIKSIISKVKFEIDADEEWGSFLTHFNHVHKDFFDKLQNIDKALTPNELRLAALLKMNLSSKEIAQILNTSFRAVEASRYRLRKKLNLKREHNLISFMIEI